MASATAKRSVTIAGHRTSISLEDAFWDALGEIADRTNCSQSSLVETIDRNRPPGTNLSSAIRLFVLQWYRGDGGGDPSRPPA